LKENNIDYSIDDFKTASSIIRKLEILTNACIDGNNEMLAEEVVDEFAKSISSHQLTAEDVDSYIDEIRIDRRISPIE
jgi:hypothetical protein